MARIASSCLAILACIFESVLAPIVAMADPSATATTGTIRTADTTRIAGTTHRAGTTVAASETQKPRNYHYPSDNPQGQLPFFALKTP